MQINCVNSITFLLITLNLANNYIIVETAFTFYYPRSCECHGTEMLYFKTNFSSLLKGQKVTIT